MPIAGIDVSHFNGEVDWKAAANSITFAFVKATQGVGFVDPRFHENWPRMRDAGIHRGAYHFFDPSEDAERQAEHFLHVAAPERSDLPPVLDVEMLKRSALPCAMERMAKWLAAVQSATGRAPIIYTTASFWRQLGDPPNPGSYPLWVAQYGVAQPNLPPAWTSWTFWQFSQMGRCAGLQGYVDLNRFSGSAAQLEALG